MVGCLQSELQVLCQNFCNVVVEKDEEGNIVVGPYGESKVKTPNPHVELPYTYFIGALPISDVSSAVVRGFYVVCPATEALELAGLVHANDPKNSSERHELQVGEVLSRLLRSIIRGTIFSTDLVLMD